MRTLFSPASAFVGMVVSEFVGKMLGFHVGTNSRLLSL
jgi:hypothetical protein